VVSSKKTRLILIECPNDVLEQKQATANGNMEDVGESDDRFPATEESSNIEISKKDVPDTLRHRLATKKDESVHRKKEKEPEASDGDRSEDESEYKDDQEEDEESMEEESNNEKDGDDDVEASVSLHSKAD